MGLKSRRQKMPTDAAGIIDQTQAHVLGMQDSGMDMQTPGYFNWVLLVPLVADSLESDQNPTSVVLGDRNPVLDYLGPGGIFALSKIVAMCVVQARDNQLGASDFRELLA